MIIMRLPLLIFFYISTFGSSQTYSPSRQCFNSSEVDLNQINFPRFMSARSISSSKEVLKRYLKRVPYICTKFNFKMCQNPPRVHVNISADGKIVYNDYISEDTEWCRDDNLQNGKCTPCIGIKKNTLRVTSSYARLCPDYRLKCRVIMMTVKAPVSDGFKFPCYEFGKNCSLPTMKQCLERPSCGWCSSGGRGLEFEGGVPGTGCTARGLGSNKSRPFCNKCDKEFFMTELPEEAERIKKYMSKHKGAIFAVIIVATVILFCLIICIVRYITKRKEKHLSVHVGSPSITSEGRTNYNDPVHA